jgi:hypothetical protein
VHYTALHLKQAGSRLRRIDDQLRRVVIDPELDQFAGFGINDFVMFHNGCQVDGFHPRLTTPFHLAIKANSTNIYV